MGGQDFGAFERRGWADDAVCSGYWEHFGPVTRQSVEAVLDAVHVAPGTLLLDVCCGAGELAGRAAARGATAVGLDFSAAQLELARAAHPAAHFDQGDAMDLPYPDGSFDALVNGIGLPHLPDPARALAEAARVLRPGGRLAYTNYADPERAAGFGMVYRAAEAAAADPVELPEGPDFFVLAEPTHAAAVLAAAGFGAPKMHLVEQVWRVAGAEQLIAAIVAGTVRAASLYTSQTPAIKRRMRAAVAAELNDYRDAEGHAVPMAVMVVSAERRCP